MNGLRSTLFIKLSHYFKSSSCLARDYIHHNSASRNQNLPLAFTQLMLKAKVMLKAVDAIKFHYFFAQHWAAKIDVCV